MLNLSSLREQVYYFLREEMHTGRILPGSTLNLNEISAQLGISKTPLRDALIQLETEGFVEILPRRGVRVKLLTFKDVQNIYEIVGALEGQVIKTYFTRLGLEHIDAMDRLNDRMRKALVDGDFGDYYNMNLEFHEIYLELSDNMELRRLLMHMKQRLYDFPRRSYIKEWELRNCNEHDLFIDEIKKGNQEGAVRVMRDVHWSYTVQEEAINRFYARVAKHINAEMALRAQQN
ncbi:MAG: GntR family transcriptional regulator [Pseudomonadota bacterium]